MPLVLASTSPHRKTLMERLGVPFTTAAPRVDEELVAGENPWDRALRLARAKAMAVARLHPGAIVIGSDQVASLGKGRELQILRKPGNRETCRTQLLALSGNTARFDTAAAIVSDTALIDHVDLTRVRFRALEAREVEDYMDREPAFDCAGGFKSEGLGATLFEAIETSDPTALIGLPLIWLSAALRDIGVTA
jgi:septum formation protein